MTGEQIPCVLSIEGIAGGHWRANDLAPWQRHVFIEKAELDERIRMLVNFLTTEDCLELPFEDRTMLLQQSNVMQAYSDILGQRIERFTLKGE